MKRTILLLTFVVTVSCMHAQRMLLIEECRNLAIQNNKELQISGEKIKMADNEKKSRFLPSIFLNYRQTVPICGTRRI